MLSFTDYAEHDGLSLAQLVRSRQVSARELAQTALAAIARLNPALGAVIETWDDEIPEQIDPTSPFCGVPFLIKDAVLQAQGRKSELGSRLAMGAVASHDSNLMARFRAAGVVTLGRTKCPEMAFSPTTEPVAHGAARNPWDLGLSTGGSSGGAAAAVASGMVPIAHANDGGGSIRIPAAACGLVGLKPSRGRIPSGPDYDEGLFGLGVELIVSTSVRDTAAMLDAVGGADQGAPYTIAPPESAYMSVLSRPAPALKIGLMLDPWGGERSTPEMAAAVRDAAALCSALGHHVEEAAPSLGVGYPEFVEANVIIWCANIAAWIHGLAAAFGRPIDETTLEPQTLAAWDYGRGLTAADLLRAFDVRNSVCRSFASFFAQHAVLLSPTLPGPAPELGSYAFGGHGIASVGLMFDRIPYTPAFNFTGLPAISLPLSQTAQGLPLGVQFGAGFGREDLLIGLAGQLEKARPWRSRRPACHVSHEDRA
jgi:amidase